MLRGVLIFTHSSTYKYNFVNPTLCLKLFLLTHYAQIYSYAPLINEGPGLLGYFLVNNTFEYERTQY